MTGGEQGGGINPEALAAEQAQELIKKLLARNQALEQQLQQTAKPDDAGQLTDPHATNGHKQDDEKADHPAVHAADMGGADGIPEPSATANSAHAEGEDDGRVGHPPHAAAAAHQDDDETKARTCVDCDKTFPTLKALNRCSTCYQRLYKRRRRALAQQNKLSMAAAATPPQGAMGGMGRPRGAGGDMMAAMQQQMRGGWGGPPGAPAAPPAPAAMPGAAGGTSDDRLLLLLRIRALLEECNRQEGDTRLMDIEGLLTSYMRMEEHGGAIPGGMPGGIGQVTPTMDAMTAMHAASMGVEGTPGDGSARKRRMGEAFGDGDGMPGDGGQLGEEADRVINPDWESMPGVCSPHAEKAKASRRRLRQVEVLLAVGLLHEGDVVTYKSRSGKVMAQGVVKGTGILCSRCGQLVGATEFEQCAGSGLRRPCENIYTADNTSLQDLLVQADKIMLDRANNVGGAPPAMEPPRQAQQAGWSTGMRTPGMAAFAPQEHLPSALPQGGLPMQQTLPTQLPGNMDINALRQVAYGGMAGAAGVGLQGMGGMGGNHFADPTTLHNLQAMFGGGDESSDDGDSEGDGEGGPPGGLQGLAGMLPQGGFGGLQGRMGADVLMEQYAALDPSRRLHQDAPFFPRQ